MSSRGYGRGRGGRGRATDDYVRRKRQQPAVGRDSRREEQQREQFSRPGAGPGSKLQEGHHRDDVGLAQLRSLSLEIAGQPPLVSSPAPPNGRLSGGAVDPLGGTGDETKPPPRQERQQPQLQHTAALQPRPAPVWPAPICPTPGDNISDSLLELGYRYGKILIAHC